VNLLKELLAVKRDAIAEINKILKVSLREIFVDYPLIKGIKWAQYTPYFNDGDACVFSINVIYYTNETVSEVQEDEGKCPTIWDNCWDSNLWYSTWSTRVNFEGVPEELHPFLRQITEVEPVIHELENELHDCFGDHVEIILLPTKIIVEEYDHE